jgi:hypothetical protein
MIFESTLGTFPTIRGEMGWILGMDWDEWSFAVPHEVHNKIQGMKKE